MLSALQLPDELFRNLVMPLLSLRDAVVLDSAVMVKAKRQMVRLWMSKVLIPSIELSPDSCDKCLSWVIARNIRVQTLDISLKCPTRRIQRGPKFSLIPYLSEMIAQSDNLHVQSFCGEGEEICSLLTDPSILSKVRSLHLRAREEHEVQTYMTKTCPSWRPQNAPSISKIMKAFCDTCQNWTGLQSVVITTTIYASPNCEREFLRALQHCHQLRVFKCSLRSLSNTELIPLLQACANLEVLSIACLYSDQQITNESISALGASCPHLRELSLTGVKITDAVMPALCLQCTALEKLHLSSIPLLTEVSLMAILQNSAQVRDLELPIRVFEPLNPGSPYALALQFHRPSPHLQRVVVEGRACKEIEVTVQRIARVMQYTRHFELRSDQRVNDLALIALADNCSNLTSLSLHNCEAITMDILAEVLTQNSGLTSLTLGKCACLDDASMAQLVHLCPNLAVAHFDRSSTITDTGVWTLVRTCRDLHALCLSRCTKLTDAALTGIATHGHMLTHLSISRCKCTPKPVLQLANSCLKLRHLILSKEVFSYRKECLHELQDLCTSRRITLAFESAPV